MTDVLVSLVKTPHGGNPKRGKAIIDRGNDDFFALYPLLYRLLADSRIGTVDREVSKVSIKLMPEGWICTLTEPASGQILFSQSDNLIHSFEALEKRLGSDKADWREDKYAKMRKAKK